MVELDLTKAINNLCEGKASEKEQKVCGIMLKNLISKKGTKPVSTKMKNGKHIHEYCKCCGQKIDWKEGDKNE